MTSPHRRSPGDLRREIEAERAQFDRWWPWWVALAMTCAIGTIVLVITGVLPLWVLFV